MRWVVQLDVYRGQSLYLPGREHIDKPIRPRLPVTSHYQARFATKKLAKAAIEYAWTKGYKKYKSPVYEKVYPRSWAPGTKPT